MAKQLIDVVLLFVGLLGQGEVVRSRPRDTCPVCGCTDSIEAEYVLVFEQVENLAGHVNNEHVEVV